MRISSAINIANIMYEYEYEYEYYPISSASHCLYLIEL